MEYSEEDRLNFFLAPDLFYLLYSVSIPFYSLDCLTTLLNLPSLSLSSSFIE